MATKIFLGSQEDIAQVGTIQITNWDSNGDTFAITVGDSGVNLTVDISAAGDTDENGTATALAEAWNASTHPYAKYITAIAATDTITLTAAVKGVPFSIDATTASGASTIGSYTAVTANQSGSDIDDAANYDTGTKPVNSDTVIHARGAPAMAWNLEAFSALTSIVFKHPRGAGNIGLGRMGFAISSDGQTMDGNAREYRPQYLKMQLVTLKIGEESGPSTIAAATRIKIDNTRASASATRIYSVAGISLDSGLPTLRMLTAHASADICVSSATGGWGIGADSINETSTAGTIEINAESAATKTFIGSGVTFSGIEQGDGDTIIWAAADVAVLTANGGTIKTYGTGWLFDLLTINGAAVDLGNENGAVAATAVAGNAGTLDVSRIVTTITTLTPKKGFSVKQVDNNLTIGTLNRANGNHTMQWS